MSSLRTRFALILLVTLGVSAGFGYLLVQSFVEYQKLNLDVRQSFFLVETLEGLRNQSYSENQKKDLQLQKKTLTPTHRAEALSHVIQAYADRNGPLLSRRLAFFEKTEKDYRKHILPIIKYLERRMLYYGILWAGFLLSTLLLLHHLLGKSLFHPLSRLNRKMVDFLNNRYTYQFSVPSPTEVGHLEATFNALAQRVLQNIDELQSLDRAKSEFLSIASHELRTPLTSIKGSLSLLTGGVTGPLNEQAKNLVGIAEQETDRLIRLINDILDLAKIEARKFPLNLNWHPVTGLIQRTLEGLQGFASTAEVQLKNDALVAVEAQMDMDRIQQVLTNLISNAIKFSPKGSTVKLRVFCNDAHELQFEVKDQGRGIAPEDQELIFQKFRQATGPDNPLVKGTGLGLAIAQAFVEEHKGKIGVHSAPGRGSTFYFTLPKWRPIATTNARAG